MVLAGMEHNVFADNKSVAKELHAKHIDLRGIAMLLYFSSIFISTRTNSGPGKVCVSA